MGLEIPPLVFSEYTTVLFTLNYNNFFGKAGSSQYTIDTKSTANAVVKIQQDSDFFFKRWQKVTL